MTQSTLDNLLSSASASANVNKAKTLQEKYKARLEAVGFKRDLNARTSKYIVMLHSKYCYKIYLGRSGAIRLGRNIATSISKSDIANSFLRQVEASCSQWKFLMKNSTD